MRFIDRLGLIADNCTLIFSSGGEVQRDAAVAVPVQSEHLTGIKIALCIVDAGVALRALVALDGVADCILLLSPAANPEANMDLVRRMDCDAIIADAPSTLACLDQSPPAFKTLETLIASRHQGYSPPVSETRWIMSSSGTTGTPKLVSHSFASLTKSTKDNVARGKTQRWGMLYDYTRFAGLQVFLQSVVSGALLITPDYDAPLDEKIALFAKMGCTHLSATPTFWRKIIMTPGSEKLQLKQVTLGGEIADDRILGGMSAHYPQARVVHIFASTEAGVGFSVSDGKAGFPQSYLTAPPAGVDIKVDDAKLYVRNPHVMPGYVGEQRVFASSDGWVETDDIVEIMQGRVFFLGRASGVINVGGDKVHPEEVERVLLAHPHVAAARVYAKSNPITGALVVADIELVDPQMDKKDAHNSVKAYATRLLERHKVPAMLKVVSGFETNVSGKLVRKST